MTRPNSELSIIQNDSLSGRVMNYQRRRIYDRFLAETAINPAETVLDVGATADMAYESSNPIESWYPYKDKITALGLHDASKLETMHPGLTYVRGNGRDLPFEDRAFDVVMSSAVLEHVGSTQNQAQFISECARVAKRSFFLTTPNRYFPLEMHTAIPLLHWLPKPMFRGMLKSVGQDFFADEGNLNLVGAGELGAIIRGIGPVLDRFDIRITNVGLGGWPAHLVVIGHSRAH